MKRKCLSILCLGWMVMSVCTCGYHPPSVSSRAAVLRLDQSHVALRVRGLPDEDISSLESRDNLQMLFFGDGWAVQDSIITDAGLLSLSQLKLDNLRILGLGYCDKITDKGMSYVSRIDSVEYLGIAVCPRITDAGLRNLIGMKGLKILDVRGSKRITDQGLRYIAQMKNLEEVQLGGCENVTSRGVRRLQSMMPQAKVVKDEREWSFHQ